MEPFAVVCIEKNWSGDAGTFPIKDNPYTVIKVIHNSEYTRSPFYILKEFSELWGFAHSSFIRVEDQPSYNSAIAEVLEKFQPTPEMADKILTPEKIKI